LLLTISTTHKPATDLGYILHKNPARLQSFEMPFGAAHVFYPEATEERCTAALLLDVDPVGLVRDGRGRDADRFGLQHYVSDRPYVASSFLSVAIGRIFGTAMSGRSKERQELADAPIPLEVRLAAVAAHGGDEILGKLFEPLGYDVTAASEPLDPTFTEWGQSRYYDVRLRATVRVRDLLTHLTVLIPVLDNDKHYWVGDDEVEKLLRRGEGWLSEHPSRALISDRYLKHRRSLVRVALERLAEADEPDPDAAEEEHAAEEQVIEKPLRLQDQRLDAALEAVIASGARRVVDLGCGWGALIERLVKDRSIREILGMDVSFRALEAARRRLRLDRASATKQERVKLIHGSLIYRDSRIEGYDAAVATEVIEHLEPFRLEMFARVVFEFAAPATVILTTPNREYNQLFPFLEPGHLRHRDHRFEWTRAEFTAWVEATADAYGYIAQISGIGPVDPDHGAPSQIAVFSRISEPPNPKAPTTEP
jgi:3' terminal RNA ribose 2'-O-methyltransferase Hen1